MCGRLIDFVRICIVLEGEEIFKQYCGRGIEYNVRVFAVRFKIVFLV
jgi:hypothetical protein